jgi:hypothetical protein
MWEKVKKKRECFRARWLEVKSWKTVEARNCERSDQNWA